MVLLNWQKNLLIVLGGILAVVSGVFAGVKFFGPVGNDQSLPMNADEVERSQWLQAAEAWQARDSDLDGLDNDREAQLGTDPNKEDTDGDGLLDGQEVDILKTDPLVKNKLNLTN